MYSILRKIRLSVKAIFSKNQGYLKDNFGSLNLGIKSTPLEEK
jgi:hypothetical protein